MVTLPGLPLDFIRVAIQNFTIVATLVLIYHFIPDRILTRSKLAFSTSIGVVFGLAAVLSIPALWQSADAPVLGFNVILVPLAGYIGGPVSSAFVAAVLLLGCAGSNESLAATDTLTIMSGILLGALFYFGKDRVRFPKSEVFRLTLLGMGIALIELTSSYIGQFLESPTGTFPGGILPAVDIFPFLLISGGGTIVLGSIIRFIDRKRQAEKELLDYQQQLEEMVRKRTAELRHANSLQKATIESTADAIAVVDRDGWIRAYNQKAAHILNLPGTRPKEPESAGQFIKQVSSLLTDPDNILGVLAQLPESAEQVVSQDVRFLDGRIFEIYVQPQKIGESIVGRVYSFHDITDQRNAEDALHAAHNRLLLLGQITRHDILNQMTAVGMHLDLAREKGGNSPDLTSHLETIEKTLGIIRMQMEFARDYQDLGLHAPVWTEVKGAFLNAAGSFSENRVAFRCETDALGVFADPMIGRVFHNFIDNSIRHGGHVTEIRLTYEPAGPDLILVYEDNGSGVPDDEKEKIFQKGFGKHTGLGMFLIREILAITDMTIHETGKYGTGVRFEIRIPAGEFRFTS